MSAKRSRRRIEWLPHPEVIESAVQRFYTHPLQTWLTLVGLFVGTAAIIVVVALGLTGRSFVMEQIEGVGSHLLWADYLGTESGGTARKLDDQIRDTDAIAVAERRDLFAGVTPLAILHGEVAVQARSVTLTVLGTSANYPLVRKNVRVLAGRFVDDDDVSEQAKVCVVSRHLYDQLWPGDDELAGKSIRTLGLTFAVIGEFVEPVDTLGQGDVTPNTIFIPITTSWFFTAAHRVDTLFAQVHDFDQMPLAVSTVQDILHERHHPGSQYEVQSMSAVVRVANTVSAGLLVVFIMVAGVSVVVGGVGIMNILLSSVEQRTREIGIRMSVGARRRDILQQFLLEALVLGTVGSMLGVVGGLALPLTARLLVHSVKIQVSVLATVAAFVFSCGVTVLFGLVPAYRAANMNPVEALRHE
ncbi:MAG TPA: ABC transporter permease [Thermoanaerobaculia bacterium]|nr:ABC transporter permease [Thermoanaerobaculia bacterium]